MIWNLIGLLIACLVLIKSSNVAVKSILKIARSWGFSEFVISSMMIGFVSSIPETFISVVSAFSNQSSLGLGTILGANIADLSIVIGIVALVGRNIKIKSSNIKNDSVYAILCTLPIALGLDGLISRIDGFILIGACFLFLYHLYHERSSFRRVEKERQESWVFFESFKFIASILVLYFSARFIVKFASNLAFDLSVPAFLIGLTIISLGTCLPELLFSINAIRKRHDGLAIGDILGNVVIDATFVIGLTALISPIKFDVILLLISGIFMVIFTLLIIYSIRLKGVITLKEGIYLIFMYIIFVFFEVLARL